MASFPALLLFSFPAFAMKIQANWEHDRLEENILSILPPSRVANATPGARFASSMTENAQREIDPQWDWLPPFDGPTPLGYSPTLWWVGFAIGILVPAALLSYAHKYDPPIPTKIPSWLPKFMFEESWTERQKYVLWITCVNWLVLSFAGQLDFNPGWSIYCSKQLGLNPAEVGLVLSTGPLSSGAGIFLGLYFLKRVSVGWLMLYTLPYTKMTNPVYAAFRTPTWMAVAHCLMALFWSVEYIVALNRLCRILDRASLPKCMGFILSFYIAGQFLGTVLMPLALAVDYNLPFILGNLCQAFLAFNSWLNFRKNEESSVDETNSNEAAWSRLKRLGLFQSHTNFKMVAVIQLMYFLKSGAIAVTMPTFFPYLDRVIGPLSPLTTSAIRGGEILAQACMHVVIGEFYNGASQSKLVTALCWGFILLGIGHLFYEPSTKLFVLFPWLRVDAFGAVRPEIVWTCGVVISQLLVALGNTIIGIVILPITQSFFATGDAFMTESIAPALYNFMNNQGSFAGNLVGGSLTMALSFGQANEVIALGILIVGFVAPIVFHLGNKPVRKEV